MILFIIMVVLFLLYGKWKQTEKELQRQGKEVLYEEDGKMVKMDVEEFLPLVVLKVWEADDPKELLKMQIVMARTNILRQMGEKKQIQAKEIQMPYYTREELKKTWGMLYYGKLRKMYELVKETKKEVITWNGELIEPFFHKLSAGTTCDGAEILGEKQFGYLQPVSSIWDRTDTEYLKKRSYTMEEMCRVINQKLKTDAVNTEHFFDQIKTVSSYGGYIEKLQIGEKEVSGETFASWFSLSSLCFWIEKIPATSPASVYVLTRGSGNGLGVSLKGAEKLEAEGKNYREILKYYYRNVKIG